MSKKQYRKSSTIDAPAGSPSSAVSSVRSRLSSSDFNPDYSFVKKDLRRIAILAGSFIGILIILTFFLR